MGGSSGGGNTTSNVRQSGTTEVINSNIPKEFYPYLQKQMQMADALLQQDYVPYGGERLAGYSPEQQQAFQGINAVGSRVLEGVSGAQDYFKNVNAVDPATGKFVPDYKTVSTGYNPNAINPATGLPNQSFDSGYSGSTITESYAPLDANFGGGYAPKDANFGGGYAPKDANFGGGYAPAKSDFGGGYSPLKANFGSGYTAGAISSAYNPANAAFGSGYQGREMTSGYNPQDIRAGFTGAQITSDYDPQQFSADRLTNRIAEYQNPYTEQVLDRARDRSLKSFQEQTAARNAKLSQQGGASSFGSRGLLANAQAEGDFLTRQQDLEAAQLAAGFDKASGLAGQDIDREIRMQGMTDQARRAASQMRTGAQESTARFGQAAGAQSLQAQIASDAARRAAGSQSLQAQQLSDASLRAAGSQTLQSQQLRDAALRAGGAQGLQAQIASDAAKQRQGAMTLQGQQMADAAARAAGSQTLQGQQMADAAARAAGSQTLQGQQLADAAARAAGAQTLQSQQLADAAARAAGSQTLQGQQLADAAARAAGAQQIQADIATDAASRAGGAQTLQAQVAADSASRAAGQQGLQADLSNQRAYAMALARGDKAALSGIEADRIEQSMDLQRLGALSSMGADLRADEQRILDTQYQDFLGQRNFPKEQLAFYAQLLRGLQPQAYGTETSQVSGPGPNQSGQLLNFLGGAASLGSA